MRIIPYVLLLSLLSACRINFNHRPKVDSNLVDLYCVFGVEYESPLYKKNDENLADVLNLILSRDSSYTIYINYEPLLFEGKYSVTRNGLVTFLGEHPFQKPTIQIWETRSFNYHFNDEFSKIYKKKQYAFCEYGSIDIEECEK